MLCKWIVMFLIMKFFLDLFCDHFGSDVSHYWGVFLFWHLIIHVTWCQLCQTTTPLRHIMRQNKPSEYDAVCQKNISCWCCFHNWFWIQCFITAVQKTIYRWFQSVTRTSLRPGLVFWGKVHKSWNVVYCIICK